MSTSSSQRRKLSNLRSIKQKGRSINTTKNLINKIRKSHARDLAKAVINSTGPEIVDEVNEEKLELHRLEGEGGLVVVEKEES